MEKDLKELFEIERQVDHPRKPDHEARFIERLYEELPNKKKSSPLMLKIAASIVFLIGIAAASYSLLSPRSGSANNFSLSQLSPELKEVESYYTSNIEIILTQIEKNKENRGFEGRYLQRLSILQEEYEILISEIKEEGPNTFNVSAMINNLRLQLELLQELNREITSSKNKNYEII
ncbi:hypothetical protein GWK08_18170 [Leptobacterium flavescens]|uniref:DUF4179 domain-containing protein n=1 Tax=Leptobacterium flavescens TaxID=472055 RepID=A0A6P0UR67_9FLAO|nr:hypothetical protein [Leptobacterium flavescens]NER15387.1 hypothetical protein [Leptobacterium flavescens]